MTAHREDGVRKFCVSLFAVMMAAILHTPALADPQDSLRKLAAGVWAFQAQNKEGLPPCPLTEVEAKELTAWLDAEYRKQGQELGQEQAAMMAGALAGYAAATKGPQKVGKNRTNAGSVPEFDISAYCKSVAMGSPLIESGCFDAEREARTAIAAMTDLPENVLRHCTDVAQTGRGSYTVMQSCINKEMNAKKQTGP